MIDSLVPPVNQVESRQRIADQYGNGFRIHASQEEIAFIHRLAGELRNLGASDVRIEPYTFPSFDEKRAALEVVNGAMSQAIRVAGYVPNSGTTDSSGLTAPAVYLSAIREVNTGVALATALTTANPSDAVLAVETVLNDVTSGAASLPAVIAGANVAGKIIVYDVPKIGVPLSAMYASALNVNNSSGTMNPGQMIIYPLGQLVLTGYINEALHSAGAVGGIGIIDWPPPASDGTHSPFGPVLSPPSMPVLYVDRATGADLKKKIADAGSTPPNVHLTLQAALNPKDTSYNVSALIPGSCADEIMLSSHSDGPNSIEDNGPAAILSIADYFLHAPPEQRLRNIRIVFTGGHMETDNGGSPGIQAYMGAHPDELAKTLTTIEIEHVGAREWVELSPGVMGLSGLSEVQAIYSEAGVAQHQELIVYSKAFDRSFALGPGLMSAVGEGRQWHTTGQLPLIQFVTGPLYLLNGPLPEVSNEFTNYQLERRQIAAFIQMVLNLNTHTPSDLRPSGT